MRNTISNQIIKEENALSGLKEADLISCQFVPEADDEACLRMAKDVMIRDCSFSVRYALWAAENFTLEKAKADENSRSAFWYSKHIFITDCDWNGPKALRECSDVQIRNSRIDSSEFGWKCQQVTVNGGVINSDYLFLGARDVDVEHTQITGKYHFQYGENITISDSDLDTKDALWHSRNVTVKNSVLSGLYVGWFTEGMTLINCHVKSYMPFFGCKGLKLIDCTMEGSEMCFCGSDVEAVINGHIDSYYEPLSGSVICDSVGEVLTDIM